MQSFLDEMAAALPAQLSLDPALIALLNWCEANNRVFTYRRREARFASPFDVDPFEADHPAMVFEPPDPDHARLWLDHDDPAIHGRLAPILRSGFDGSSIALWRNETGGQSFVHLGSGSGSTMAGVLSDDPADIFLLMALGYSELCEPAIFRMSPADYAEWSGEPLRPVSQSLAHWIETQFGRTLPKDAASLMRPPGDMDGPPGDDPFLLWLQGLRG